MRKKLLAGIGAAALFALMVPTSAMAASEVMSETLTDPIGVDNSQTVREFTATAAGELTGVTVMVDFLTHDGEDCATPAGSGPTYPDELGIALISPAGTVVNLVNPWRFDETIDDSVDGTYYDWEAKSAHVQVTFDDGAAEVVGVSTAGVPVEGTFQPVEPLSVLVGEDAAGKWQLVFADNAGGDAKCYYGATLMLETPDEVEPVVPPAPEPQPNPEPAPNPAPKPAPAPKAPVRVDTGV